MKNTPIAALQKRMKDKSLRALAREIGCSAAYLSDIMRGQRAAGPKILSYLGMVKIEKTTYANRRHR